MRPKENFTPYVVVALIFTIAILSSFQLYISREPGRIETDEARDNLIAVTGGRSLYNENCAMCHGEQGEGVDAPPLNDKTFLTNNFDDRVFSLISSGVPSSEMPAWSQVYGGPFTDQEVSQLVAFIRAWEEDAPDQIAIEMMGDSVDGLIIFNSTCIVCHGENGQGTSLAPILNDPTWLAQFDDDWIFDTISGGRLAQGMPTWGTVLPPSQIRDLIALLRAWENGENVQLPGPEEALAEALHMLDHGDLHGAEHGLRSAAEAATGELLSLITNAIEAVEAGSQEEAVEAIEQALEILSESTDGHTDDEHDPGE